MFRKKALLTGLIFLVCLVAAGQAVQSQQTATTTVTSFLTSNQVSTIPVGTATVTTAGQSTPIFSNSITIPGTHGVCGIFFDQSFNGTGGELVAGSVTTSSAVDVYVMTESVYKSWTHQIVAGGNCAPSSLIANQRNTTSFSFSATLPGSGNYYLVVNNLSETTVTAQVNLALTNSPTSIMTAVEYSTITQPMIQTIMQTLTQTLQTSSQSASGGPDTTTLAGVIVILIVVAAAAFLAKSRRGKAAKQ